jgi:hypothetical protein
MARVFNYRLLLVMALVLSWVLLSAPATWAIVGVEIGEREVVRVHPAPPVPTYECGMDVCECHGEEDCNRMFEELDCVRDLCEGSGDSAHCACIFPIEKP